MEELKPRDPLASWVCEKVQRWIDHRDGDYKKKWDEYYRIWRGIHAEEDKTRKSERSKLISPASQQAVESAVSELEEATFGRNKWFDLSDDVADQEKEDLDQLRARLHEDADLAGIPEAICESYLLGAIYGTGIGKVVVEEFEETAPAPQEIEGSLVPLAGVERKRRPIVRLVPVPDEEFAIDPAAKTPDDGMGCAHVFECPKHRIVDRQIRGVYRKGDFGGATDPEHRHEKGEQSIGDSDFAKIIEYAGLVPRSLLENTEIEEKLDENDELLYEDDMVEALVTIANDGFVLKAVENPYLMNDRPFIAFPYDKVPNRFWGRGVIEKGYHPQKALDAELRSRIDGLAISTHPMAAVDATRLPRGMRLDIEPGRMIPTNGNPNEIMMPFNFGNINPNLFRSSGDLERMIQMATGSMDSATPVGINPRNQTASGMSMMMAGAVKRSKRTLQNIERKFLVPLLNKMIWRYIQFYPERYPIRDYKFVPRSAMGIMAREYEQIQLTNLLQTIPPESPIYYLVVKSIYENSSLSNREEAVKVVDQMAQMVMEKTMNPEPPPPDANMLRAQIEGQRLQLEAMDRKQKNTLSAEKLLLDERKVAIQEYDAQIRSQIEQADRVVEMAKARADEAKTLAETQIDVYKAELDSSTKLVLEEMKTRQAEAKEMSKMVQDIMKNMNAPRTILRDNNGRPIGVEIEGVGRQMIKRDENGRPTGLSQE